MRDGGPRQRGLRVIESLQLGAKKQLLLVSCKGERFLVGTGAEEVQSIIRLRREDAVSDAAELL
jgi:flagellar biogenesis protein FliO